MGSETRLQSLFSDNEPEGINSLAFSSVAFEGPLVMDNTDQQQETTISLSLLCARMVEEKGPPACTSLSPTSFAISTHLIFQHSLVGMQEYRYYNALFSLYNRIYV